MMEALIHFLATERHVADNEAGGQAARLFIRASQGIEFDPNRAAELAAELRRINELVRRETGRLDLFSEPARFEALLQERAVPPGNTSL